MDRERAEGQWQELVALYGSLGHRVSLIEAEPRLPDMVRRVGAVVSYRWPNIVGAFWSAAGSEQQHLPAVRTAPTGHSSSVDHLPNAAQAERNQRRKLAFVPLWPVVAAIALVVILILAVR
ncbi:MAG: hypothetical protein ACYCO3_12755 [Mycobacteriales bacterium]